MPIEYCCFISYPHGQDNVLKPLMKEFFDGLRAEVYAQTRKRIWIDFECLQEGDRWNDKLATDLCKSICMVVVYTPLYFDAENAFCAREYSAMELLEEKRLRLLASASRTHGLIIPIVLRGEKRLPSVIKRHQYYKFDDLDLADPQVKVRQRYASEIHKIAEYIIDRCYEFDRMGSDPCTECDTFTLPSHAETKAYIERVLDIRVSLDLETSLNEPTDPFPGRARSN
ncbi:MAG: toll/interleukin-1 receptor domain-containing protein [Blastocatellia bacterium]